jgi:hypothetical protein
VSRGNALAPALALACLPGCAFKPVDLGEAGLSPDVVLSLESGRWQDWIAYRKLYPGTRPVAVRDLRCIRPRRDNRDYYSCRYRLDYAKDGAIAGSLERKDRTLLRDNNGTWSFSIIVTAR